MTEYDMRISDWSSDVCSSDRWGVREQPGFPAFCAKETREEAWARFLVIFYVGKPQVMVGYGFIKFGATAYCIGGKRPPLSGQFRKRSLFIDRKSTRLNSSH